jgi:hypothetical protein
MKKNVLVLIFTTMGLFPSGQEKKGTPCKSTRDSEAVETTKNNKSQQSLSNNIEKASGYRYIYTDTTYAFATGKGITIQNSYPKGGMIAPDGKQYNNSSGKRYGFVALWSRIINETTTPVELHINFPADSFAIFTPPDSYLKLLLPTDTLTVDKLSSFNYGLTGLQYYLDANINKATTLQKTINPNQEHMFYIVALSYNAGGTVRSGLFLKEEELYYTMSIAPHGSGIIPSGKIAFKN